MQEYLNLFIDPDYPTFLDKYLKTKTLKRLQHVTQFCGCDYTNLYSPLFLYTRFDHSLVVAHMTYHFTHDKKEVIAALLHDIGTPAFAHTIDYVFGDYIHQESSEKNIIDMIKQDDELLKYLKEDSISLEELQDLTKYEILENKSPKLCTDRLDGVLHTCFIWLHTHSLEEIKEVYDDLIVLKNEDGKKEIGFQKKEMAEKFSGMVKNYAIALQENENKYTMEFVASVIKKGVEKGLITMEDLYKKKETDIVTILKQNFSTWEIFTETSMLLRTDTKPSQFYVSLNTKKRNVIPLVKGKPITRITEVSKKAKEIQECIQEFQDTLYAYIEKIKEIC